MLRLFNRLTLTQQWICATLLALLPLVVAVLYASQYLESQAQNQRDMILSIDQLNKLEAGIKGQVTDIERSARQYLLLRNTKFLDLFEQNVSVLHEHQRRLLPLVNDKSPLIELKAEVTQVQQLLQGVDAGTVVQDEVGELVSSAKHHMRAVSVEVERAVQHKLEDSERQFSAVMQRLMVLGVWAVPGTVLMVILSSVAVARPMWRLATAIRRLGHGQWQEPIAINGPADLKSLGASLEWMRERLDASERQKQAFLRHITHELKTPLAAIMEAGSLLRDQVPGSINDAQQQVVRILMSNADNLQALIQQLLNYNAVAHGLLSADAMVDIRAMCEKICSKLLDSRPHSRVKWSISGSPESIQTDPQALDMILSNLLSNAHDFTSEAGEVAVAWGQDSDRWWLSVCDSGPGLSPEECENIFKPFFQGKARRRGPLKGTGLGLAIVQECVVHLNGEIKVVSGEGGAEFHLSFPLRSEKFT